VISEGAVFARGGDVTLGDVLVTGFSTDPTGRRRPPARTGASARCRCPCGSRSPQPDK
jgi:hypothetical protein